MRSEVTVPRGEARIDGDLSEWPEKNWAAINPKCSFQMSWSDSRLCVAYHTDQPNLLRNSASAADFPFAFTQGGGLDLMLRSAPISTGAGASATQDRNPMPGDLRLFVTRRDGQTLAVLYRQKLSPASTGKDGKATPANRQTFASPVGQVTFNDVQDVSNYVQVASSRSGTDYEFSVDLAALGLQAQSLAGRQLRGDAGFVLSDGTRARARLYWHNKADSMCADVPSEARINPGQWGLLKFEGK